MKSITLSLQKIFLLTLLLCLVIPASGCRKSEVAADKTLRAIVLSVHEESIMTAVSGKNDVLTPFEPVSVHYKDAKELKLQLGTVIEILFDGTVMESYPPQISAKKIKVIEEVADNWPPTKEIPEEYPYESAKADGLYVEGLKETANIELVDRFLDYSTQGITAYLRKVSYTIEGDPIITDVIHDGSKYYAVTDASRDAYASKEKFITKEYSYINTYEKDNRRIVYLADRKDINPEDFEELVLNPDSENHMDAFILADNMISP
ncbi:DUF4362 domain-containing protein [Anaerocolumna sp. AGMB13020]|uniref:DUF4362 domain-containing protein n=1 Tax=Anaerocolumna sp. AGMB13020 TaxID=3081750 RepID=UPI0029535AA6|nr:DUF4362 domain-containing protein [Anaerocolumna sp. AGMB13020]WOO38475.1 DUF4362 domain-containing protein [Anaerocolumna sp. AGMB13020]